MTIIMYLIGVMILVISAFIMIWLALKFKEYTERNCIVEKPDYKNFQKATLRYHYREKK